MFLNYALKFYLKLYIWFFDPISLKSWIFGSLILVGAISACLFPLWPPKIRDGAYYLSLAGTCFVGLLFVLYFGMYNYILKKSKIA